MDLQGTVLNILVQKAHIITRIDICIKRATRSRIRRGPRLLRDHYVNLYENQHAVSQQIRKIRQWEMICSREEH